MTDELLSPPLPDGHAEILRLLKPRLALFECRLVRPAATGAMDVVDIYDGHVIGHEIDDLEAFTAQRHEVPRSPARGHSSPCRAAPPLRC